MAIILVAQEHTFYIGGIACSFHFGTITNIVNGRSKYQIKLKRVQMKQRKCNAKKRKCFGAYF